MDPFNEVRDDAWKAIAVLEEIIGQRRSQPASADVSALSQDFDNNYQELLEIYEDLQQAIAISESQPQRFNLSPQELSKRKHILVDLDRRASELKSQWDNVNSKLRAVTTMSNRISQDGNMISENPFADAAGEGSGMTHFQEQQMIQEQDLQLDSIHVTMQNLNQQAQIMGNELEDQGFMLDDLDYEIDNVDNKLQRGMKRINIFLERNKETASNWCIGILVVVLCVLLVILIIA
ncbi:uncharacterized protein SPAPADRAFT_61289 [Spathaspora passalidarum NRRL Y-27907]|uniref:t-SNARE affecting a late Golgi compartment protein 1 n=1 Tax=Spathaspora passalidarum (strain NRRL Y-27907 / 11-Y1) TaxID=619300 RepID=G3APN5_SPAPN|nr:uncharacterized protein SPAPADRAFT_61289 [Spathaspora passalidarum NRRL Y-27907]EGW32206.1 hypothetical protein SPAPADRAFT_61289 [Spathaspora passalidarum NRRL Y-27907]